MAPPSKLSFASDTAGLPCFTSSCVSWPARTRQSIRDLIQKKSDPQPATEMLSLWLHHSCETHGCLELMTDDQRSQLQDTGSDQDLDLFHLELPPSSPQIPSTTLRFLDPPPAASRRIFVSMATYPACAYQCRGAAASDAVPRCRPRAPGPSAAGAPLQPPAATQPLRTTCRRGSRGAGRPGPRRGGPPRFKSHAMDGRPAAQNSKNANHEDSKIEFLL